MSNFTSVGDQVEARTAEIMETVQAAALDALREEVEGTNYLSPVDARAVFEACVVLSRTFPRALKVSRKVSEISERDVLVHSRPERSN
jgi:hypothetical protein